MATINGNQITLDGIFADWPANDMIMTAANTVAGYQVYGAFVANATVTNTPGAALGNTYVIGIDATPPGDTPIGAGTIIYLNTDQNNTTGFSPFGGVNTVGAEYEVIFAADSSGTLKVCGRCANLTMRAISISATLGRDRSQPCWRWERTARAALDLCRPRRNPLRD